VLITWREQPSTASATAPGSPRRAASSSRIAAITTMLSLNATPMRPNVPRIVLKLTG
jgi:hypothetical protein